MFAILKMATGLKNKYLLNRKEMNTPFYNDKLDKKGLYLWCLPEKAKGRRFLQTHKIGMTTRSFASRNKKYSGTMKNKNWTANYLLPLNVDDEKVRELEKYVKKKLFQYAQAHPTDIIPHSKDWTGEYYDVDCRESDNFKQLVFDLFQQIQIEMIKDREDLLEAHKKEIKDLKKLIVQDCKNKNVPSDNESLSVTAAKMSKKASVEKKDNNPEKSENEESSSMVARLWKFAYTGKIYNHNDSY